MAFDFSKYDSGGSGWFLSAAEKKVVAESGIPFVITKVVEGEYNGEPRYVVTVTVPNPETGDDEERGLGFGIGSGVESRDAMLAALMEYLDGPDAEEVKAKLEKIGKAYLVREA